MTDDRGAYKPLTRVEDHQYLEGQSHRNYHVLSLFSRPRICLRIAIIITVALAALFGYEHLFSDTFSQDDLYALDAAHLERLASPLDAHKVAYSNTSTSYVVGEHHPVSGEYPEDYQWIDPYSRQPFEQIMMVNGMNNNAMARMPVGSQYDMMVVARGRNDKYHDKTEDIPYVNLTLVGFFVNYEPRSGAWIRAGPEPYILDIPVWRQYPRPCDNLVNGGPADPRLIWSDAGEPLAIIGTSSRVPGVCKAVGLADLRAVWPGLRTHLESIGYGDIPIRFKSFTEIGKVGERAKYEKNWAAFFSGPKPTVVDALSTSRKGFQNKFQRGPSVWPYFATQIKDRTVVSVNEQLSTDDRSKDSYVLSEPLNLEARGVANATFEATSQCIFDAMPTSWNQDRFHLATPFYRVTFCPRGTCVPSRRNTVLLGLIHYKQSRRSYRRMFVTMKVDAPFEIISVSPPLHFGSTELDDDVVFSVSMAFLPTKKSRTFGTNPFEPSLDGPGGWLAHGWLDDTIVVGAGLRDAAYDAIHLPVATALQGHTLCSTKSLTLH